MEHSRYLAGLILAALLPQVSLFKIDVEEIEDKVVLKCNTSVKWLEGTVGKLSSNDTRLDLGKRILDPRGVYACNGTDIHAGKTSTIQVYYRTDDTQALMRNDQLYQPLRDRDDAQYSRLGGNWPRNK
ncbi:PREDICTED: T-cell surface glycoprotein CD3 delta chain isoform X2 [Galeopterus variegatus]|uniref:T-cell surface glycoprotein CD3 delta chain n=1 Tax=Galeopterus variegatus TaxID=482537 RepID=A0ABM0QXP8_GALVR|nr:PREDICTED: T-cell surface glycoprotein CD3 delta chain isoform X2 [Galeopterus variegatus]